MQSAWRIIDCTNLEGRLRYARGRLLVCPNQKEEVEIPIVQTAVILLGLKASCSTALLFELAKAGVSVLLCDWRGIPIGALHSWNETPTVVVRRQHAQINMSVPRRKNAWMQIVKSKVRGQAHCLDLHDCEGGDALREMAKHVRSGDVSNIEGQAARLYWGALFPIEDFHRIPGGGSGRNALLDYAYAILRGFVIKAIVSAGLIPSFGVNHHNRSNYYCLADDLIEPYRPVIDDAVASLPSNYTLEQPSVKKYLVNAVNDSMIRGLTIPSSIMDFAQCFAIYCESKERQLDVPVFGEEHEKG